MSFQKSLFTRGGFDAFGSEIPAGNWGVNFGGGVNSTALLLILADRGIRPDWVVFSDTGSERPETYKNVERVGDWCRSVGFPFAVTRWVRMDGTVESVHDNALRTNYLPSKAYGFSGCTYKWKIQPLQKWRREHGFSPTTVAIAYDIGEQRRLDKAQKALCQDVERDADEAVWYPLVGWAVDRASCVRRIEAQGWETVKSACFCCPNMKPVEWDALKVEHPDLYNISLRIESGAKAAGNATSKSLFRSYSPSTDGCVCTADGCTDGGEVNA